MPGMIATPTQSPMKNRENQAQHEPGNSRLPDYLHSRMKML